MSLERQLLLERRRPSEEQLREVQRAGAEARRRAHEEASRAATLERKLQERPPIVRRPARTHARTE
eukprot:COSAG01_NODE_27183_length_692_cov_0.765599_1_plen_65_part_01